MVNFAQVFFLLQALLFIVMFVSSWVALQFSVFVNYGAFTIIGFLFVVVQAYRANSFNTKLVWLGLLAVSAGITLPTVDPVINWTNFLFVASIASVIAAGMRFARVSIRDESVILFLFVALVIGILVLAYSETRNSTTELAVALGTSVLLSAVLGIEMSIYDIVPNKTERIDSAMYVLLSLFAAVVASGSAARLFQ